MTTAKTPTPTPSCQRIQANAAGLASLDERDVERLAAFAHAADCPACRGALAEGEQLMRLLGSESKAIERPSAAVMARVSSEILASMEVDAGRQASPRSRGWRGVVPPVALVSAVWLAAALIRLAVAPSLPANADRVRASLAMVVLTTLAGATALMLGGWLTSSLPVASLLMSFFGGGAAPHQFSIGIHCAGFEMIFALVPVLVAGVLVRRRWMANGGTSLAIAAGGGALVAQAVLHAICHAEPSTTHNLLFHTMPLLLALLLGGLAGRRLARLDH